MLPLKLGKACPPANKYGDDPELPFSVSRGFTLHIQQSDPQALFAVTIRLD